MVSLTSLALYPLFFEISLSTIHLLLKISRHHQRRIFLDNEHCTFSLKNNKTKKSDRLENVY